MFDLADGAGHKELEDAGPIKESVSDKEIEAGIDALAYLVSSSPKVARDKRRKHRYYEKKRRENIKEKLAQIQGMLPAIHEYCPSKIDILKATISYIEDQSVKVEHLGSEIVALSLHYQILCQELGIRPEEICRLYNMHNKN